MRIRQRQDGSQKSEDGSKKWEVGVKLELSLLGEDGILKCGTKISNIEQPIFNNQLKNGKIDNRSWKHLLNFPLLFFQGGECDGLRAVRGGLDDESQT